MYLPCSSSTVAVMFTNSTSTFSLSSLFGGIVVARLFILYQSGTRSHFIPRLGEALRGFSSGLVPLAYHIPVPIRNFHHEISFAIRNALAAEPAVGSKTRRERQFFV